MTLSITRVTSPAVALTRNISWCMSRLSGIDRDGADIGQSILIIGASGGVGSIGIQLAKRAGLTVIATAFRADMIAWFKELGVDDSDSGLFKHVTKCRPNVLQ